MRLPEGLVIEMEFSRCKIAAIEIQDPRCSSLLEGIAIGTEDSRCRSLVEGMALEVDDARCAYARIKMEDPRCQELRARW
jgi:hypothetical protein